jgi:hypothetical protein
MNRFYKTIAFLLVFVLLSGPIFAADPVVIEPYTKDEFPSWAKDLRRAEIITLGSLPFVTLTVTLAYSLVGWSASGFTENTPSLFSRTTDSSMTEDDQLLILGISLGVSVVLGLVDLFVNIHKRKKTQPVIQSGGITVVEVTDNAVDSSLPESLQSGEQRATEEVGGELGEN